MRTVSVVLGSALVDTRGLVMSLRTTLSVMKLELRLSENATHFAKKKTIVNFTLGLITKCILLFLSVL